MKKHIAANGSDTALLVDYASYVSNYAATIKNFKAWEGQEMNDAKTAYDIQV